MESLGRSKVQSHDYLRASEQEEERAGGQAEAAGTVYPVFEIDGI